MATLIIETGAVVTGANSYVSIADADTYFDDTANSDWPAASSPDTARIAALIRGAAYVDRKYSNRWPGTRKSGRDQPLMWPRKNAIDAEGYAIGSTEIPIEVQRAQMEAAVRELVTPGSLSPDIVGTDRVLREKVGQLEVEYADAAGADNVIPDLTIIDEILSPIIPNHAGSGTAFVNRA